jgi:putative oxidoreductase
MENLELIGHILFGGFFVFTGLAHFMNTKNMTAFAKSKKLPAPKVAVLLSGLVLALGGLGIVFQQHLLYSMWALVAFLVVASVVFHNFWADKDAAKKKMNMVGFLKNMALVGALLVFLSQL